MSISSPCTGTFEPMSGLCRTSSAPRMTFCRSLANRPKYSLRLSGSFDRSKLPDNLNEYFGLFASERQNVIRGAELVRQSPLIGSNVPVHGLLIDILTGRLEWLVNGYQTPDLAAHSLAETARETAAATGQQTAREILDLVAAKLPEFHLGEMKFPEFKIGETTIDPNKWLSQVQTPEGPPSAPQPADAVQASVT